MENLEFSLFLQSTIVIVAFLLGAALLGWFFEAKYHQHAMVAPDVSIVALA